MPGSKALLPMNGLPCWVISQNVSEKGFHSPPGSSLPSAQAKVSEPVQESSKFASIIRRKDVLAGEQIANCSIRGASFKSHLEAAETAKK
jgi:hypothetical protein